MDIDGLCFLYRVCMMGYDCVVEILIDYKVNVDLYNKDKVILISVVCKMGFFCVV